MELEGLMDQWSLKGTHGSGELEGLMGKWSLKGQGSLKGAHGSGELEGLMGKWSLKGTHGSVKGHWSRTSHHYPLLLLRSTRTPLSASMLVDDHDDGGGSRNEVPGDTAAGATS